MLLVGKQDDFALPLPLAAGHEQVCGAVGGPVQWWVSDADQARRPGTVPVERFETVAELKSKASRGAHGASVCNNRSKFGCSRLIV